MAKSKVKNFYGVLSLEVQKGKFSQKTDKSFSLSETVTELRRQKDLSQIQLCRKAPGLDPKTLNAVEKGRIVNPSLQTLQRIALGLDVTVSDLFRQAELKFDRNLYVGNQKGVYQVDFSQWGIRVVSFTPFVKNFFCGKVILGARRRLTNSMLQQPLPIYISQLVGRVEAAVANKKISLREGDNLFFNGALEHSFYNPLEKEAVFLLVTAPSFI